MKIYDFLSERFKDRVDGSIHEKIDNIYRLIEVGIYVVEAEHSKPTMV